MNLLLMDKLVSVFHSLLLVYWDFLAQPSQVCQRMNQNEKIPCEKFPCGMKFTVNFKGQSSGWADWVEVI